MAHCDAAGVNGSNRIRLMALRFADDAEWMSGKFRDRLAPVLTEMSSWISDRRTFGGDQSPLGGGDRSVH